MAFQSSSNDCSRFILLLSFAICRVLGHGFLSEPPPRGTLGGSPLAPDLIKVDSRAPTDSRIHFPAGVRGSTGQAGLIYQQNAAGKRWNPFTPLKSPFTWRAGVCGDPKRPTKGDPEHLRGGKYYYNGRIVRTYIAGSIINFQTHIAVHHNGFLEFHLCDVSRCRGEITPLCFRKGACRQLRRARNPKCDSGYSKQCAPIDPEYPGRWYLPCPVHAHIVNVRPGTKMRADKYGFPDYMKYVLPNMSCEHCVLHWFYTAAAGCNPPGVISFFQGPRRPRNWGKCKGQGNAKGGFNMNEECGKRFPEEYYACADVRLVFRKAKPKNPIEALELGKITGAEFKIVRRLGSTSLKLPADDFKAVTFRVRLKWAAPKVDFYITDKGRRYRVPSNPAWKNIAPYYAFGFFARGRPLKWENRIIGREFKIEVVVGRFKEVGKLMFTK